VVEAIIERLDVKHELFVALEAIVSKKAILATNTSSISIAALARPLQSKGRFVGLHFFNPANIMKLVEVIRGPETSDATVKTCMKLAKEMGKVAVVAKDVPGFIVNRVARNYYNEAQRIVMEGAASIEQVDALMRGIGFRMGPFELMDLIGVDTNLDVTKSQWEQFFLEPRFTPSLLQQQTVDAGHHGRKTGKGFYDAEDR
jgi:3-hydroxybutyryl-CoA dehydrogenase